MAELLVFFMIAALLCPVSLVIYIVVRLILKYVFHVQGHGVIYVSGIGTIILIVGIVLHNCVVPIELSKMVISRFPIVGEVFSFTYKSIGWKEWIVSDPITIGTSLITLSLTGKAGLQTPERQMVYFERLREEKQYANLFKKNIDYVPTRSSMIFGVSGAGKSAYIARSTEDTVALGNNPFIILVDGKGSCEEFSLYYSAKLISKKYGLKLRVINGTANDELEGTVYDFLDGISVPNQAKDMIMALLEDETIQESSGSQHYRVLTEAYMEKIITFMMSHGIRVSLANVVKMMKPDNFDVVCNQNKISSADSLEMKSYMKHNWQDVSASVTKLELFLGDQGKKIFTSAGGKDTTNLRKAYHNGEMVLVLADEMSMPQLAQGLVKILAMDLRNLTALRLTNQLDMDRMVFATFDEFTSYTSALPILKSMFARARSADCVLTLATQSISDITALPGNWFQALVNTADRFVIFRQHGSESPEEAASLIGTELHVTATARVSDVAFSGEASNTLDRQFIIHPDAIRELPANTGILLDKKKGELCFFKNKFIETE